MIEEVKQILRKHNLVYNLINHKTIYGITNHINPRDAKILAGKIYQLFQKETDAISYLEGYLKGRKPDEGRLLTLEAIHPNKDIKREWINNHCYYNPFDVAKAQDAKTASIKDKEWAEQILLLGAECQERILKWLKQHNDFNECGIERIGCGLLLTIKDYQALKEGVK